MKFVKAEKSGPAVPKERPAVDSNILAPAMGLGGFRAICQRAEGSTPAGWGTNVRLNTQSLGEPLHANYCRISAFSTRVRLFLRLAGENSGTFSCASYCSCVLVRSIEEKT